jgi:glutamate decarboxylase
MEAASAAVRAQANTLLNRITRYIQKTERGHGRSFVSRTRLNPSQHGREPIVVFRVVLANPLTTLEILADILEEQRELAAMDDLKPLFSQVRALLDLPAGD